MTVAAAFLYHNSVLEQDRWECDSVPVGMDGYHMYNRDGILMKLY